MSKYGNFGGATASAVKEQASYDGFGYNGRHGKWMVGQGDEQEELTEINLVVLGMRRCKEVGTRDDDDRFHASARYPIYTNQRDMDMTQPERQNRIQVIGLLNGDSTPKVWGSTSYTVDAFWHNPKTGSYNNELFPEGYWRIFKDFIKTESADAGVQLAPSCFELTLKVDPKSFEVGSGRKKSVTHRILIDGEPKYVGEELATKYDQLYASEDIDAWIQEWEGGATNVEPVTEDEFATDTVEDDSEQDEIPF